MKIIKKEVIMNELKIPNNSIFIDIETTGFSRFKNRIYLIGTLAKEGNKFIFRQILTEFKGEEKDLLREFIKIVSNYDTIITFNGQRFDLPFIVERAKLNSINFNFENYSSIDIYQEVKTKAFLLDLENQKLKTLEKYLGINRDDLFSGGDLVPLYYEYESGNKRLEPALLLHNEEDILNMPKLFKIFDVIESKNKIVVGDHHFIIDKITVVKNNLSILGNSSLEKAYFNKNSTELVVKDSSFKLNAYAQEGNYKDDIKCIFVEKSGLDLTCHYNYETPKEILLVKYDKSILYKNAHEYFKKYLENIL